ncbi:MAG: circadian clock KaiB family protein [Bacteroidota bacterium]
MKPNKWIAETNGRSDEGSTHILRLFITGASPNSIRAVDNVKAFCEKYLKGNYQLEIIDVYQQPQIAEKEQIIALPLLIKRGIGMDRRLIGDMSDTNKLLESFSIKI